MCWPLPLASVLTRDPPRGLYLQAPLPLASGWARPVGTSAGAGREAGERGWVPPSMVTVGWLCPLAEGRESCLVAQTVPGSEDPFHCGLGWGPSTVVPWALHQPGVVLSLPPLSDGPSAISSLDLIGLERALCPLPRLSDRCLRPHPPLPQPPHLMANHARALQGHFQVAPWWPL